MLVNSVNGCSLKNHRTFVFVLETLVFVISDGLLEALSFSLASSRNSGASRASTAASSLMSCRQMCKKKVFHGIPHICRHLSCDISGHSDTPKDAWLLKHAKYSLILYMNVWPYISVGEQSFNHRMVMSWDSFGFQYQVETDVRAVTASGNNSSHYPAHKQRHKQESTIKVRPTWDKAAVLFWGSLHPVENRNKNSQSIFS